MKKWKKVLAVLTATMALAIGSACMAYAAEGEINVNGTGVVLTDPDAADISLSIETNEKTSQAAQKENNKLTQAVTNAMTELGITKDNIVTTYTSVYPIYNYNDETGKRSITGYRSSTDLQVTTKDINNTGKYIDAALKAGATGTNGVSFYVSNESLYYGQALQVAAKNAEVSAAAIAQVYGKPLGAVKKVTELSSNSYYVEEASMDMAMEKRSAANTSATGANGTTISYGKMQISANVSVTYTF